MKTITVHSSKGGSGKTFLVANTGMSFASSGKKCVIIDCDVSGPSFNRIFLPEKTPEYYLNDFLLGKCSVSEIIHQTDIKALDIIYSDPAPEIGKGLLAVDRSVHSKALKNLSSLKMALYNSNYNVCLLDTTPGLHYMSINALLSAKTVVLVVRPDSYSLGATKHVLNSVYAKVKNSAMGSKQYFLLFNQVPNAPESAIHALLTSYETELKEIFDLTCLGHVNCLCNEIGVKLVHSPLLALDSQEFKTISSIVKQLQ
ncbi:MAG: tyrosine-protein kinase family protein [Candidatus Odinarchaeota archaeon]